MKTAYSNSSLTSDEIMMLVQHVGFIYPIDGRVTVLESDLEALVEAGKLRKTTNIKGKVRYDLVGAKE